ncbi:hypothetical protein [Paludisphaera rhizosphaerae]|uniref:hypothetical protein n=1 Tax=Paludisphaera rhizosphaerae TaxID=2711216 RepID=UPI0013EA4295|nr:hypothetical protein [Paludisphaera rhizosphaerae]
MESTVETPRNLRSPSLSNRLRLIVVGLVLARGVVGLTQTPPFEGWDEYQHVAYIGYIHDTGQRAILNQTQVPADLIAAIHRDFPQPESARVQFPQPIKPHSYESYWNPDREKGRVDAAHVPANHGVRLYQAQHSWWYYIMVGPLFRALGGLDNLRSSVAGVRLLNLAFVAGAVWIALGVVAQRVPDRRTAGWIALMIGVQPLLVMNAIRVSNDAAGLLFSVAAVAAMLSMAIDSRRLVRQAALAALLTGLAIVMKATNFALLPALGLAWLIGVVRTRPSWGVASGSAAAIACVIACLMGPDLAHNFSVYGMATPMQEAIENRAKGRGLHDLYKAYSEFHPLVYARWLFGEGVFIQGNWSWVLPIADIATYHRYCVELAAWGLVLAAGTYLGRRGLERFGIKLGREVLTVDSVATPVLCLGVVAGFFAALLYHALQSAMAWGITTTGPWYAAPAIPWLCLLAGVGAMGWSRFAAVGFVTMIVGLSIVAEQTTWWIQMPPVYSGGRTGMEALQRISTLQPWFLSTITAAAALASSLVLFLLLIVNIAVDGAAAASQADAAADANSSPHRPTWLRIGRKRERLDPSEPAVPAPSIVAQTEVSTERDDRTISS